MEAASISEKLVNFTRLRGAMSQNDLFYRVSIFAQVVTTDFKTVCSLSTYYL
jgi:hypothetical protein